MPKRSNLFRNDTAAAPADSVRIPAPVPPSRVGKRTIVSRMDPDAFRQLRRLSVDNETSVQQLAMEAFNLLFEKYGLPLRA